MRDILVVAALLAIPFIPWRKSYEFVWEKYRVFIPGTIEEFDILLRKKWPMIQTNHLFLFSFILITASFGFFLLGSFLHLPTLPLPVGVMGGFILPFLAMHILKPNIEASFLFEVSNIHKGLRTQVIAGARPQEALSIACDTAEILKSDLEEILLHWGGDVDDTLQKIAEKYTTDELNILLSLIREMNKAGASDHKEVIQAFDRMKEMMEDEIANKEAMNDEKEMDLLEMSSFLYIFALIYLMIIPLLGDVINNFNQLY